MHYLLIAIGGMVGATSRYFLQGLVYRLMGVSFPYGTLAVNLLGSLIIGVILEVSETKTVLSTDLKIFLSMGVLGSFTTFSAFSYETLAYLRDGETVFALSNIGIQVIGGLVFAWLGVMLAKVL